MRIRGALTIGLVVLTVACGGGGGGDGGDGVGAGLLTGPYRFGAASAAVTPAVTNRTT